MERQSTAAGAPEPASPTANGSSSNTKQGQDDELRETAARVAHDVIETSIGLEVLDGRDPGAPAEPQRLSAESRIEGAWALTVRLRCDGALAREFAHKLFDLEDAQITDDEVEDAFLEVANMIVGNLKAAHEGQCSHSRPEIIESATNSGSEAGVSSRLAPVQVFTRRGALCLHLLFRDPQ